MGIPENTEFPRIYPSTKVCIVHVNAECKTYEDGRPDTFKPSDNERTMYNCASFSVTAIEAVQVKREFQIRHDGTGKIKGTAYTNVLFCLHSGKVLECSFGTCAGLDKLVIGGKEMDGDDSRTADYLLYNLV